MIFTHTCKFDNQGWRDLEPGDDGVVSFGGHFYLAWLLLS